MPKHHQPHFNFDDTAMLRAEVRKLLGRAPCSIDEAIEAVLLATAARADRDLAR